MIGDNYVHHITVSTEHRNSGGGTKVNHYMWKGTSQQIADQVATAVKSQLDHGETHRIELTPIAPFAISDLGKR